MADGVVADQEPAQDQLPDQAPMPDTGPSLKDQIKSKMIGTWQIENVPGNPATYRGVNIYSPEGWGNEDTSDDGGTSWCRIFWNWDIEDEIFDGWFTIKITTTAASCGIPAGRVIRAKVQQVVSENPLTYKDENGATLRRCTTDWNVADGCSAGNMLGLPQQTP